MSGSLKTLQIFHSDQRNKFKNKIFDEIFEAFTIQNEILIMNEMVNIIKDISRSDLYVYDNGTTQNYERDNSFISFNYSSECLCGRSELAAGMELSEFEGK